MDVGDDGDPHGPYQSDSVPMRLRLPVADRGRAGGGGGGRGPPAAARGLIDPLAGRGASVLQRRRRSSGREDFRAGQLWLCWAQTASELGVLVLVVARPPRACCAARAPGARRRGAPRRRCRWSLAGSRTLPLARDRAPARARTSGWSTQDWGGYAGDVAQERGDRRGARGRRRRAARLRHAPLRPPLVDRRRPAVVVAFGVVTTYAGPVVLDPLFNKFTPLPAGPDAQRRARAGAARRASTSARSTRWTPRRRTTAANAYVTGLGHTKRVVLYDNLLKDFTPRRDAARRRPRARPRPPPRRAATGCSTWRSSRRSGMFAVGPAGRAARAARRAVGPRRGAGGRARARACSLPAITTISNQLSRGVEARADAFSLELTRRAEGVHRLPAADRGPERLRPGPAGLACSSCSGTHPTTMERIGLAMRVRALGDARRSPAPGRAVLREVLDALASCATSTSCPPWRRSARA